MTEFNSTLSGAPEKLSEDPESAAWLVKLKFSDPKPLDDLMDQAGYQKFLKETED